MKKQIVCFFLLVIALTFKVSAEETSQDYSYYGFHPEIVTNYISSGNNLGYVRIGVELMIDATDDLLLLERHDALLRAAIIEILGRQGERRVKSTSGREDIRRECLDTVNRLLLQETGKAMVINLLFTRYLFN